VLDAVGTEGGSGTAFIVITDDDIVTQVLSLVPEHIKYNHSESSLKMYSKLDKLFRLNYIQP
jgi:hypothetical protein